MVPYYVQLVQSPKYLVILHEYLHLYRGITLDGSPHPPDPDPFWMGHSIGKWEGDTLVVDSIGFKESEINGYRDHRVPACRRAIPAARISERSNTKRSSRTPTCSPGRG